MAGEAPVFRGCPRCGGAMAAETLRSGARALGCLHCDAIVLTRADLQAIIDNDAVTEEAETESVDLAALGVAPPPRPASRKGVHWGLAVAFAMSTAAVGLVAGAAIVMVATRLRVPEARPAGDDVAVLAGAVPETPAALLPSVAPAGDPAADPAVAPPAGDPAAPVAVTDPAAAPAEAAPAPKKRSPIERGWKAVDAGDLFAAKDAFEEAYTANPNDGEAMYALGYALHSLGKPDEAKIYLCQARARPVSVDTSREINGLIAQIGASCP